MRSGIKRLFTGVSAFAAALLYFFMLALSISLVWTANVHWYFVLSGWAIVTAVLYEEKEYSQIVNALRGGSARRVPDEARSQ